MCWRWVSLTYKFGLKLSIFVTDLGAVSLIHGHRSLVSQKENLQNDSMPNWPLFFCELLQEL